MIGVIANSSEHDVAREFFELFKTPWEFYRADRHYEIVLCTSGEFDGTARMVIFYAGRMTLQDDQQGLHLCRCSKDGCVALYRGDGLPIYGDTVLFPKQRTDLLTDKDTGECIAFADQSGERLLVRIGYDLFGEVRKLLTVGQPVTNASMPALELHIAFLRDTITSYGISIVEIPPLPEGHHLIACLTHDVDHASIRQHKWDHTACGFLYRALFGSAANLIRGRISLRDFLRNWAAALKLPLVYLGIVKDFWQEFGINYLELEGEVRSTFFVIPFKNSSGMCTQGSAPPMRAARYSSKDVADTIHELVVAGCEVGLHGIDAWLDASKGRLELDEIRRMTGAADVGVRMHWLYYDRQSPNQLESAGAAYDSTVGYNETVGYRAGTTQAFKPIQADSLIELPLHVMDTALFYPAHLGLSQPEAKRLLERMIDQVVQFGGCLTINWHDRSIAPERLWDACYRDLLHEVRNRGAWISTARDVVAWFRKRRSAVFETDCSAPGGIRCTVKDAYGFHLPGLRLRIHNAPESARSGSHVSECYFDIPLGGNQVPVFGEVTK